MAYLVSNDFLILIQISVLPYFSRPIFHLLCSLLFTFSTPLSGPTFSFASHRFPPSLPPSYPSFVHFLSPESEALIISRHGKSTSIFRVCRGIVTCVYTHTCVRGHAGKIGDAEWLVANSDTTIT